MEKNLFKIFIIFHRSIGLILNDFCNLFLLLKVLNMPITKTPLLIHYKHQMQLKNEKAIFLLVQ
jgi:hypothetical protein